MKVLKCNCDFYSYPDGISNIEQFVDDLNEKYHSFIKLKLWKEDECCEPYFVETEYEYLYVNVAQISEVTEADITLLSKDEYDRRLTEVVNRKCLDCKHYEEDEEGCDHLAGHRSKLSLDGDCFWYSRIK